MYRCLGVFLCLLLPSANIVAARLCFHRRLSFCAQGGAETPPGHTSPLGRHPAMQTHPGRHTPLSSACWDTPPPRRPLQQMVCILLKCILVLFFLKKNWKTSVLFCFATDTPLFRFKTRVDHLLACFITCMQWIPQIHL